MSRDDYLRGQLAKNGIELVEAKAEIARLQRIIDSRPAINAALPDSYIQWSQSIYELEFVRATGAHS
ncbi:hypothetical protein [Bradyrhizobium ottawaense]